MPGRCRYPLEGRSTFSRLALLLDGIHTPTAERLPDAPPSWNRSAAIGTASQTQDGPGREENVFYMRKNMPRNQSASFLSPRIVPPLKRPNAVRTKLPGSNSITAGRSLVAPCSYVMPSGDTEIR